MTFCSRFSQSPHWKTREHPIAQLAPYRPTSSGEIPIIDLDRGAAIDRKHRLIEEYLGLKQVDGLLIQNPANFAWFTAGAENVRQGTLEPVASLFLTRDARVVLTSNVHSGQLFDRELNGFGFQLKERPWQETRGVLCQDMCRGRNVLADTGPQSVDDELSDFRRILDDAECDALRALSRDLTHAVDATARAVQQGDRESEVAGHLSHRLLRHGITPLRMQVMADFQGHRYRHWGYGEDPINRHCVISAVGRRRGLCAAVTRSLCFGQPPAETIEIHQAATILLATSIYFSKGGWAVSEIWKRIGRIYEKLGIAEEWRLADQGETVGYDTSGMVMTPGESKSLATNMAIHWHPSVRFAATGETILVRDDQPEWLTQPESWPMIVVNVKGDKLSCPDMLCRETASGWES